MKISQLALAFSLIATTSNLFAQDSLIKDLGSSLDQKKNAVEESLRPMLDEKSEIEKQQTALQKRLEEIENKKTEALGKIEQGLSGQALRELLAKKTLGKCKITTGASGKDLEIEQDRTKIRFVFDESKPVLAKLLGSGPQSLIEVHQDDYVPVDSTSKTSFKAVLRFEPGTEKIVHAVFTGERIEDGLMGWSSSRKPTLLSCLLE